LIPLDSSHRRCFASTYSYSEQFDKYFGDRRFVDIGFHGIEVVLVRFNSDIAFSFQIMLED